MATWKSNRKKDQFITAKAAEFFLNFFIPHIFSEFQSFEIVPPVAGISGTKEKGCNSLVLAGGYEDDTDDSDEFSYIGSEGRDLSGNKRTAEQSFDQTLTKSNAAIAVSCNAKFNNVEGAESSDCVSRLFQFSS